MKEKIIKQVQRFIRKCFLLSSQNIKDLEKEALKKKISKSELLRHIINNWFKK